MTAQAFQTKEAAQAAIGAEMTDVFGIAFYGEGAAKVFGLPGRGWYVWNRVAKRAA